MKDDHKESRDDFSLEVKRTLAARAGHRCSVCRKSTSGPGTDDSLALSDGNAAHITAAAPGGPRFDKSLTSEERRSITNGIWACTQCAREIDSDALSYPTELLRGLKRIREDEAGKELHRWKTADRGSALLVEFPYVETSYKLFEIISAQQYNYPTTSALRDLLRTPGAPVEQLLSLSAEIIPEISVNHPNVAGILSTLLSTSIELWEPTRPVFSKLEQLCEAAVNADDWSRVAFIEPLAFAVGAKGRPDIHKRVLERLLEDKHWRETDATRSRKYYGTLGVQIAALIRHWHDPFRHGLLQANDISRLIDLLMSSDDVLARPTTKSALLGLLEQHVQVLENCGEAALAKRVRDLLAALRFLQSRETEPLQ